MSSIFGSNSIHQADCFDNACLYTVFIDDQITQIGRAPFAVLRRSRNDLEKAVGCMLDDIVAMCVITRFSISNLVEHWIALYKKKIQSRMAGPAEGSLFYLCLQ